MAFYKITDKALLEKINGFFDELNQIKKDIEKFVEQYGFEDWVLRDTITYGFELTGILIKHDQVIDQTKWKTSPFDAEHRIVSPRRSNRSFYKEWLSNSPIMKVSYQPLIELIITEDIRKAYATSINWTNRDCFLFETKYAVVPEAIEILTSEYNALNKGWDE